MSDSVVEQLTRRKSSRAAGRGAKSEKVEDYTARYTPRSYRRWSEFTVATTALGGMAYLADFAIGGGIGMSYGTANAVVGILVAGLIIFVTAFPLGYYTARYNIDIDLVTRGSGFGYYGSVITEVVYFSYCFIFFATEGSIMAQGLKLGLKIPLWLGYLICALIIIPLVFYGMNTLNKVQVWTTPIWIILIIFPIAYLAASDPHAIDQFLNFHGASGTETLSAAGIFLAAGAPLALTGQIAEQNDVLRFMPPKTDRNRHSWWAATILAGPGWMLLMVVKQILAVFLAVYVLNELTPSLGGSAASGLALEPVEQFREAFKTAVPGWLALTLAVILVVVSQVKINVVNGYSGSLAWTNAWTRVTKRYPGRVVFLLVNLAVALALMEGDMFSFLNKLLAFYANCGIAWIMTAGADIIVNKKILKISPELPEFRRPMLYAINPVGVGAFLLATGLSWAVYFGGFGLGAKPYSPLVAAGVAIVAAPVLALITRGKYYLKRVDDGMDAPRFDADGNPAAGDFTCHVCGGVFERPDMMACPVHGDAICSMCLTTDVHGVHILEVSEATRP